MAIYQASSQASEREELAAMTATPPLTYSRYLHLDDLLAQHVPLCPSAHDEHLFITVHHVHELWFKLLLIELTDARDRMLTGEAHLPQLRLQRCHAIEQALLDTLHLLDTMTPTDFLAFRSGLGTASGAQSAQYHEVEILSGRKDPNRIGRMGWLTPAERTHLERRLAEPSVWDGFLNLLTKAGYDTSTHENRDAALTGITHDSAQEPLADLAEALIGHDQAWSQWRTHHLLIAERQIGSKPGTGGTTGAPHLKNRAMTRLFPELWEFRSKL
ncbi:tryptophan 2,3-dioxygenase family protein [Streptomyces sp. CA-251387]|uniref:tryptophan 2,3-dioxygenase family protein n=1 Tax=Streptomyces sp. CA-251387 TaxID=3240064 RepID=UPI003D9085F4